MDRTTAFNVVIQSLDAGSKAGIFVIGDCVKLYRALLTVENEFLKTDPEYKLILPRFSMDLIELKDAIELILSNLEAVQKKGAFSLQDASYVLGAIGYFNENLKRNA